MSYFYKSAQFTSKLAIRAYAPRPAPAPLRNFSPMMICHQNLSVAAAAVQPSRVPAITFQEMAR
jgi:hypothetical protein